MTLLQMSMSAAVLIAVITVLRAVSIITQKNLYAFMGNRFIPPAYSDLRSVRFQYLLMDTAK